MKIEDNKVNVYGMPIGVPFRLEVIDDLLIKIDHKPNNLVQECYNVSKQQKITVGNSVLIRDLYKNSVLKLNEPS